MSEVQPTIEGGGEPQDAYPKASRRSRPRVGPGLLVLGAFAVYLVVTRPVPPLEGWQGDYEAALTEAQATNQKVLVEFYMPGCPPCSAMEQSVLRSSEVRAALAGYVPVRIDASDDRELANQFEVLGTPTYAIIDANGALLSRCEGYQPIQAFVRFLTRGAGLHSDAMRNNGPRRLGDF